MPPRRRPKRTGASYHNKVLTVAKQSGEGLVWGLPLSVSQVERHARADERLHHVRLPRAPAPVLFDELIGVRCQLSSSMAWASDMGAGTSSFKRVLGLYQCIICIGASLNHKRTGSS